MQIGGLCLASQTAIDSRIKKAIEFTQSGQGPFADALKNDAAKNATSIGGVEKTAAPAKVENDIDWGSVSANLGRVNNNVIYTTDISRVAELALKDATAKLDAAFTQAGISNTPPVDFTLSRYDGSLVVGDHPQKDKIEALLADNPELAHDVREAFVLKDNAIVTEKGALYAEAYQRTYASKGKAAADALTSLFFSIADKPPTFRYGAEGLATLYGGQSDNSYLASIAGRLGVGGSVNLSA
jgi:hypothetical protein